MCESLRDNEGNCIYGDRRGGGQEGTTKNIYIIILDFGKEKYF